MYRTVIYLFLAIGVITATPIFAQDYRAVDTHALNIDFTTDYRAAAAELTAPFDTDVEKARALFTWVAHHLEYDTKRLNEFKKTGRRKHVKVKATSKAAVKAKIDAIVDGYIADALETKKGVCQDYSYLYRAMCNEVGLECAFITGFGRFSPNNIGNVHKKGNHAWNAVKINGTWQLIDVTWSTGMGSDEDYGNGFFMVPPEIFILSHFPDSLEWQLLDRPIDKETFADQPFMYSGFLKYHIQAFEPLAGRIPADAQLIVRMTLPVNERLVLIRGKKPVQLTATTDGNVHTFDLSKRTFRGNLTLGITNGQRIEPLIAMKAGG